MAISKQKRTSPCFAGLRPASPKTSRIAAKASIKQGTKCEVRLCRSLQKLGLKFESNVSSLPGRPDFVFHRQRVVVFADGDFWHGRNLANRIARLSRGHNGEYWIRKIRSNVARDRHVRRKLKMLGWRVIRVWESEINSDIDRVTTRIVELVRTQF